MIKFIYTKDPFEAKYQFLIKKREDDGTKDLNHSKAFIEYSCDMNDIYKQRKALNVFNDMTADMLSNKKRNPIVTEFFIRGGKLKISYVFITKSYFAVPKILY